MTRRRFVILAGLGAVGAAADRIISYEDGQDALKKRRADQAAAPARQETKFIKGMVESGMSDQWTTASIWPGLAILAPGVSIFSDPTLSADAELPWPKNADQDHLAIQRPFMVRASMELPDNFYGSQYSNQVTVNTLGFWLPNSQQIAFCDQDSNWDEIVLASNAPRAPWDNSGSSQNMAGQSVTLAPATQRDGLTYRYLVVPDRETDFSGNRIFHTAHDITKVCGRSALANLTEVADYYHRFEDRTGGDIIQLPEAGHGNS